MAGKISGLVAVILFLCLAAAAGAAQNVAPKVGGPLPEMELLKPNNSTDSQYLGLSFSVKHFRLTG